MNDQVTKSETAEILRLATQATAYPGDFVELGCYRGLTSVLLGKILAAAEQESAQNLTSYGKTVHNLPHSVHNHVQKSPNSANKSSKSMDKSDKIVQNMCKTSQNPVDNQCKTITSPVKNLCKTPKKRLWIYDSFAGLPEKSPQDQSSTGQNFQSSELLVTKREVVNRIRHAGLTNVIIKKAWFDQLTDQDLPPKIAFAFLDGDFYDSIRISLKLVTPRLTKQGIIIVHDYNNPELPGSARAVDEFLRTHPSFSLQQRYSLAILTS